MSDSVSRYLAMAFDVSAIQFVSALAADAERKAYGSCEDLDPKQSFGIPIRLPDVQGASILPL